MHLAVTPVLMNFGHDLLHKIFSIIAEKGSRHDLLTLCLVCIEWKRVASDFYWSRLALRPARLDSLIRHFATKSSATAFYPTNHTVVKELAVTLKEAEDDDGGAFRQKVVRLARLLRGVHTLHLDVKSGAYREKDDSLKEITCLLVDQLHALRHMTFKAAGLDLNGTPNDADKKHDTAIRLILTDFFKRVALLSLDLNGVCPLTNWFSLYEMLDAQSNIHTLKMGFVFNNSHQFILGLIAKANLKHLRRLDLVVRPVYTNESHVQPSADLFQQRILDATKDFVGVCTKVEHFSLEVDSFPQEFRVNLWIFLGHLSRLKRLKVLRVGLGFFDLSQQSPRNFQLRFPKVQGLHFIGSSGDLGMNVNLTLTLSQWKWPALKCVEVPRWSWRDDALGHMLSNAPQLIVLDIHFACSPADQVAYTLVSNVFPRLKSVCIRTLEEHSFFKVEESLIPALRRSCPHATIHISLDHCCMLYYGVDARLHEHVVDKEPVYCYDMDHMNDASEDDEDNYDDYDDDQDYDEYDSPQDDYDSQEDAYYAELEQAQRDLEDENREAYYAELEQAQFDLEAENYEDDYEDDDDDEDEDSEFEQAQLDREAGNLSNNEEDDDD
jgi:hypothetical protein